jgi:HK97 family phage major capsid protein
MSTFVEIKSAIDRQMEAFEAFKETNDARIKALEKGDGGEAKHLAEKLERIEVDVSKWSNLKTQIEKEHEFNRERIEALEARASNPKKTAIDVLHDEYKNAFNGWIRARGQDASLELKMQEMGRKAQAEHKSVSIGSNAGGGFAVPEEISREIQRLELLFSPVRSLVKVVQAGTSDYKELVSLRGAASGWTDETTTRNETATPTLRQVTPTNGELYAYPMVTEWSLDDIFFNVESWLAEEVAQEFAYQEGLAVIDGDGSNKPTGMLDTDPVLTADFASPLRAAAAYQYIACDTDIGESPTDQAVGVTGDCLIDTIYTLNSAYRSGATWVMNSATTGAVRKLKTVDGAYHWAPSLQAGQPAMLLGYPVATWEQMPDIGSNNFPIGFGNWRRAYTLVDRVGMRITRDNITSAGFVKFYVRRREGGIVTNNDAAKFIRTLA